MDYKLSNWQVLQNNTWKEFSAQQLISMFEEGAISGQCLIKAGNHSQAKPLRSFIKELVLLARQELQNNLVQEDAHFALAEVAPFPTAISDLGGRITYVNQAFCDFLGYEQKELIGLTVGMLSHEEDHQKEVQKGNMVLSGTHNAFQIEKRYLCKDGSVKKGQMSLALLHKAGQPYAALAQIYDLTAHLELQQALIQAQSHDTLGKVSQHVTHDLKNILMALRGTLDLLQEYEDSFEQAEQELISDALVMCDKGKGLIQNLLSFDPTAVKSFHPVQLDKWIIHLSPILERLVFPFKLKVEILTEVKLLANKELLERALINLCVNAKQAVEAKAEHNGSLEETERQITVELKASTQKETQKPCYKLSVTDCGIGMKDEIKERVLEPFFTTKKKKGGSGIGMINVWNTCVQHQAQLDIETELLKGTTFTLSFISE